MRLGAVDRLPEKLTRGQRHAAKQLLRSRDFLSLLVGDAGTGKTTVLSAIEGAHVAGGGARFLSLAPTTRARDALIESGFGEADTIQRFLVSEALQAKAAGRVLLIDEAGLLSTQQLDRLTAIAEKQHARLLLVGDTKQHYSVQRGDALRHIVEHTHTPVVRLAEVLRQREEPDRRLSRLLASGETVEALLYADRQGMIQEAGGDEALFAAAAEHYARNVAEQVETLVVIPIWDEIERFNAHARRALRCRGLLGDADVVREAVKPLSWTEEQKQHWDQYQTGDRLLFVRDTRFFRRGTAAEVIEVLSDGLRVRGERDRVAIIARKQRGAFEVGRAERLAIAAGDRLLIRGRDSEHGFANGDLAQVAWVNSAADEVVLTDGRHLPADFKAWTYGHALTAYRSQGSTAEESLLVLGEIASRSLGRRQFYVANTRYRGAHRIYVASKQEIFARLQEPDAGRELATEFVERRRLTVRELIRSDACLACWRTCDKQSGPRQRSAARSVRRSANGWGCDMDVMRKPRMFFDEAQRPSHVTFDDGERTRRSLPWSHYHSADWDYADPTAIRIEIGEWQVVISGHNLEALFRAIEDARLARIRAHPEFADDPAHEVDVFGTHIRLIHLESTSPRRGRGAQLQLPI